jgi:general secretion pathway protein G
VFQQANRCNFSEKGQKMKAKSGFTLVEILIVVVILGILAAIVIPQFTEASTEAKLSSLCTDLQTIRSQIELYKIQHNDVLPNMAVDVNGDNALTLVTLIDGSVVAAGTADSYGPYIQKIPTNQFNDDSSIRIEAGVSTAGAGTQGWVFNTDTGAFHADTADHAAL